MSYQLGIDLGTTYTAAAVWRSSSGGLDTEVVSLGSRSAPVASVLYLGTDGTVLVGDAAERRALTDPDLVVREFKRRIGDETPMIVGGRSYTAHQLSARLARWVYDRVAERQGGPPAKIVLTHPATWGRYKQDLLGRALADIGLNVTFLAEPLAAAASYAAAERVEAGSTIAVYDLGGGTFDVAVVRKTGTGGGFELLGRPEGIDRLGGVDFDEAVFAHVRAGIGKSMEELDETDQNVLSAVARLRRECVEAKEALSSDTEAVISVLLPDVRTQARLVRSEFEAMIRPALEQTISALRAALESAGRTPADLRAVLLVGGSSRIPLVSQMVSHELGRPVAVDADPKTAIAVGAALSGAAGTGAAPGPSGARSQVKVPPLPSEAARRLAANQRAANQLPSNKLPVKSSAWRAAPAPPQARPPSPGWPAAAGAPFGKVPSPAAAPAQPRPATTPLRQRQRRVGPLIALGGMLAVAAITGVIFFWPKTYPNILNVTDRASVTQITASCVKKPAQDSTGAAVNYDAKLMLDAELRTAWACDGDGAGVQVTLDFGRPVAISAIGIVPGYAKTDPADGTDRYRQNRRLSEVVYVLDDGYSATHRLDTSPDKRDPQTVDLGGRTTQRLVVKIVSSDSGEASNGKEPVESVAISELAVRPAQR